MTDPRATVYPIEFIGGERGTRTLDLGIMSRLIFSTTYRVVPVAIGTIEHSKAQQRHAKLTHSLTRRMRRCSGPRIHRSILNAQHPASLEVTCAGRHFCACTPRGIIACDFLVVVTATFRLLYVFVVVEHGSRLVHCNLTANPTAGWTLRQFRAAVGFRGAIPVAAARSR